MRLFSLYLPIYFVFFLRQEWFHNLEKTLKMSLCQDMPNSVLQIDSRLLITNNTFSNKKKHYVATRFTLFYSRTLSRD